MMDRDVLGLWDMRGCRFRVKPTDSYNTYCALLCVTMAFARACLGDYI